MQKRYVVVPAVPIEKESFNCGGRFYASTISGGFDIYDNQEKLRIIKNFQERNVAEKECAKMNEQTRNPDELFPILRAE